MKKTIRDLQNGDFFIPLDKNGKRETHIAFLFLDREDQEERITIVRSYDKAIVNSFYNDPHKPVDVISIKEALALDIAWRQIPEMHIRTL